MPVIKTIQLGDLSRVLGSGFKDFLSAPMFGLFFGMVFFLGGLAIYLQLAVWGESWRILPVAVGFPLLAPFVAVGLYEVSRELEKGQKPDWATVLSSINLQKSREIPWIAFVVLFFFGVWTWLAHLIFALFFGLSRMTNVMSGFDILFTSEGVMFLVVGSAVGAVLAFILFSITVVAVPLLLDREVDFVTAMITSVGFVLENLFVMLVWGAIVAALMVLAMLPFFAGLVVVLPVLGHATWHLYRRALEAE
ncbi:MAG: DUF2189 domain-containing protein [Rhodobacteraceae bacterium]|nr:DUF2189 domain-containing protein [Paracoccaceae bacterium]